LRTSSRARVLGTEYFSSAQDPQSGAPLGDFSNAGMMQQPSGPVFSSESMFSSGPNTPQQQLPELPSPTFLTNAFLPPLPAGRLATDTLPLPPLPDGTQTAMPLDQPTSMLDCEVVSPRTASRFVTDGVSHICHPPFYFLLISGYYSVISSSCRRILCLVLRIAVLQLRPSGL
jgi:hypothetical protein